MKAVQYVEQIESLQVFCNMKERGCGWFGKLSELDTHLDSSCGGCQYMDMECPLNCQQIIPKNKIELHLDEECIKREYICRYCDFEATYEEVVSQHLPDCEYFPVPCPNKCGESCERSDVKSHLKECLLEVVTCEFSGVGCGGRFNREDQEVHSCNNIQKHLYLTATTGVDENRKLKEKLQQQEWKLYEQDVIIHTLKKELKEQTILATQLQDITTSINSIEAMILKRSFIMQKFYEEKSKDKAGIWKSPAMYTHMCGYKFCIGVDANGREDARGNAVTVYFESMQGEHDNQLKWPARVKLTLELVNQKGGENVRSTRIREWNRPIYLNCFEFYFESRYDFLEHAKLDSFLHNNTLYFIIVETTILV